VSDVPVGVYRALLEALAEHKAYPILNEGPSLDNGVDRIVGGEVYRGLQFSMSAVRVDGDAA